LIVAVVVRNPSRLILNAPAHAAVRVRRSTGAVAITMLPSPLPPNSSDACFCPFVVTVELRAHTWFTHVPDAFVAWLAWHADHDPRAPRGLGDHLRRVVPAYWDDIMLDLPRWYSDEATAYERELFRAHLGPAFLHFESYARRARMRSRRLLRRARRVGRSLSAATDIVERALSPVPDRVRVRPRRVVRPRTRRVARRRARRLAGPPTRDGDDPEPPTRARAPPRCLATGRNPREENEHVEHEVLFRSR